MEVAVIVPTLNEEEGLEPTVSEIQQFLDRPYILVVDGNSTDRTVEIARELGLDVVFQEGRGKGCALSTAFQRLGAKQHCVVLIDSDFTYPASTIPYMMKLLEDHPDVGMVSGNRFDKPFEPANLKSVYYLGNRFLALAQHLINGIRMSDPLTGLRVVRREILQDWQPSAKGFDVEAELNYQVERQGYKIMEVPIQYRPRLGKKKLQLRDGFTILRRMLIESLRSN